MKTLMTLATVLLSFLSEAQRVDIAPFEYYNSRAKSLSSFSSNGGDYTYYSKATSLGMKEGILKGKDTLTRAIFDRVRGFSETGIQVVINRKFGFVDTLGQLIIPAEYDMMDAFCNNRAFVAKGQKWAMINNKGKLLTGFVFDDVGPLSYNRAAVKMNGKVGYVDSLGKIVIPCQFESATGFAPGYAVVYSKQWLSLLKEERIEKTTLRRVNVDAGVTQEVPFLINKAGKQIFSGKDGDAFEVTDSGFIIVRRTVYLDGDPYEVSCLLDGGGKVIIPFDRKINIVGADRSWYIVRDVVRKRIGLFTLKGTLLLPCTFFEITNKEYNEAKLAKAYLDKTTFFYINEKGECVPFEGISCPDKN